MEDDIQITDYARERMLERGCSADELQETLLSGDLVRGFRKYSCKAKTFASQIRRLEQKSREKRVEVIYYSDSLKTYVVSVIVRYIF